MTPPLLQAITRATTFLLAHQDPDGAWRDFLCTPGRSEAWTTAYIATRLLPLLKIPGFEHQVRESTDRAATFLLDIAGTQSAWGYNRATGIDADSTAHVILFLHALGLTVPLRTYSTLASFQLPDGAFATYPPSGQNGGWASGHPDVTAVALRALSTLLSPTHIILRNAVASLHRHLEGPYPHASYWWPSPFYLRLQILRLHPLLTPAPEIPEMEPSSTGFFDQALALHCALLSNHRNKPQFKAALHNLCLCQLADGSWPAEPILRVASPRAFTVEEASLLPCTLVPDDRRLFTTATVLDALTHSLQPPFPSRGHDESSAGGPKLSLYF